MVNYDQNVYLKGWCPGAQLP